MMDERALEKGKELAEQRIKELARRQEKITLLIDSSGSMGLMMDGAVKTRMHSTTEAILAITNVSDPKRTSYSLVSFHDTPTLLCNWTDDYISLYASCFAEPQGSTQMARGISAALQQQPDRIIMLSDGEPTCGYTELWNTVDTAASLGIKIDTISIGGASDNTMKEIASRTGGKWQRPKSPEELCQSFMQLETRNRLQLEHHTKAVEL